MARVKLIQNKEDIAPEHYDLFNELAALRGRVSGPSTVMLHNPALARPWNQISEFLHTESVVEPQYSELVMAATAREKDCGYIWAAHTRLARRAGVAEATITAVRDREATAGLPAQDAAVVTFARQLLQQNRVQQDVFDQLLQAHGAQWLVELTCFVGRYGALAGILNAFEVTPESPDDVLPVTHAATPWKGTAVRPPLPAPRLKLISTREEVAPDHRSSFDALVESRGEVQGPFRVLMYSPVLCTLVADVGSYLRFQSPFGRAPSELAIIATAREKDCPYVWAAHAHAARQAGVRDAAIAAVRDRGDLPTLEPGERDVVDYVRQLLRTNRVTQTLFDRLRDQYGVPWLVELTALIGHYGIITGILNAFEFAAAPDAGQLPLS